jgi:hypothetical protein
MWELLAGFGYPPKPVQPNSMDFGHQRKLSFGCGCHNSNQKVTKHNFHYKLGGQCLVVLRGRACSSMNGGKEVGDMPSCQERENIIQ